MEENQGGRVKRKKGHDEISYFFIIFSYSNQNQVADCIGSLLFLLSSEKILHVILQCMVRKLNSSHTLCFFTQRNIWSFTRVHSDTFMNHLNA